MTFSLKTKFLHRVRIHDEECGAVARALHHEVKIKSSPAVKGNVFFTTKERKQMSTKTYFKRVALAVVAALGFGLLSTSPAANAAYVANSLTITSSNATSTVAQGETATTALTVSYLSTEQFDSVALLVTCAATSGASCPDAKYYWSMPDSNTGTTIGAAAGAGAAFTQNTGTNGSNGPVIGRDGLADNSLQVRAVINLKAVFSLTATDATYTYTISGKSGNDGAAASTAVATTGSIATWTVTVTKGANSLTSTQLYAVPASTVGVATGTYWQNLYASSKDSAVVAAKGTATSPTAVGYIYANGLNANGETLTAGSSNFCSGGCDLTVAVSGPGLIAKSTTTSNATGTGAVKTLTHTIYNGAVSDKGQTRTAQTETLTVYSDGTAGTSTVNFYNGSTLVGSRTFVFTGSPASANSVSLSDTVPVVTSTSSLATVYLYANVLDSGSNAVTTGATADAVYVYASDTKVVRTGALSTDATQYTQKAAGTTNTTAHRCNYDSTSTMYKCTLTVDTGTSTLVLRDSWTVAASTWVSSSVSVNPVGRAASFAISFDKATYAPGERAIMTLTGKDLSGNATGSAPNTISFLYNTPLGNGGSGIATGSKAAQSMASDTYSPNRAIGTSGAYEASETFVVSMPVTGGTFTVTGKTVPASTNPSQPEVTFSASVTVVDPVQDAQNKAIADAQAAADAATDAALQAIDAANAATDAANLSAEAADAATVAAEEAKDAADAATAAVEALATQVATLMAALQAQIRSLANTVAKIAKKVKA